MKHRSGSSFARAAIVFVVLAFAMTACRALPTVSVPEPTPRPICASLAGLEVAVDGLRDENLEDASVLRLLGAVGLALVETDGLATAVGDVYRPLVDQLDDSLVGLRDSLEDLEGQRTVGASIATVGVSMAEVGVAMDALSLQLQAPCE